MNSIFTITEPTVRTKKGKTKQDVVETVITNLKRRMRNGTAVRRSYNKETGKYQDECTIYYGSKSQKTFWANEPLNSRTDKEVFAEEVLDYIPNFTDLLWEAFKVYSKTNSKNAKKRNEEANANSLELATLPTEES